LPRPSSLFNMVARPAQAVGLALFVAAFVMTLTFRPTPAAAAVTGSVTPNSGLHDGDTVHVTADGLPANTPIQVLECEQNAQSSAQCEGNTTDVSISSDSNGHYDNPNYSVYVLPGPTIGISSIHCDGTHPCALYVGTDYNNLQSSPHVLLNISFAAGTATTTTTTPLATTTTTVAQAATTTTTAPGAVTTTTVGGSTSSTTPDGSTTTSIAGGGTSSDNGTAGSGGSSGAGVGGGGSSDPNAVSGSGSSTGSTLPMTSAPPLAPWLAGSGILAFVAGTVARRRALREIAATTAA